MPSNPCVRIAHRGASADYPENTLLAFTHAIAQGVDMIELDVNLTHDGELVVIHDAALERTTNGAGLVRDRPLADIRRLDAGRGQHVPLLAEVFDLVRSTPVRLCVEIKGETDHDSLEIPIIPAFVAIIRIVAASAPMRPLSRWSGRVFSGAPSSHRSRRPRSCAPNGYSPGWRLCSTHRRRMAA